MVVLYWLLIVGVCLMVLVLIALRVNSCVLVVQGLLLN